MSKPGEVLREELYHFAMVMEGRLLEHEDRGGWRDEPLDYLFKRLVEETGELSAALLAHKDKEKMIRECADAANFAMMIADNLRRASARRNEEMRREASEYWKAVSEPEVSKKEIREVLSGIVSAADAEGAVDQRDKVVIQTLGLLIDGYFELTSMGHIEKEKRRIEAMKRAAFDEGYRIGKGRHGVEG